MAGTESARIIGSSPCISSEALPMQPAFTKVRRSMISSGLRSASLGLEAQRRDQITIVGLPFTTAVVTHRYGDNLVVSRYTFASPKHRRCYDQSDHAFIRNHGSACSHPRISFHHPCANAASLRFAVERRPRHR